MPLKDLKFQLGTVGQPNLAFQKANRSNYNIIIAFYISHKKKQTNTKTPAIHDHCCYLRNSNKASGNLS